MAAQEPTTPHPIHELMDQLAERREQALHAGSDESIARQHSRGKLTARERIDLLLDPGSFHELDMLARHRAHGFGIENNRPLTDGVVTGWGTVDGRKVFLFAQDFTVFGGALGEVFAEKIHKVMDLAASTGAPFIGLYPLFGRRSPAWEIYPAWKADDAGQERLLGELADVAWVLVDARPIGGDENMQLSRSHPRVWQVLMSDYERVQVPGAPETLYFLHRKRT